MGCAELDYTAPEPGGLGTNRIRGPETAWALGSLPDAYNRLSRLGLYGDFFTFYLCDVQIKVNGPDGNPVYIPIIGQRAGRCTP